MCFGLIGVFYGISPYIWLILMPMVGSFSGDDPVLRLSVLFLIQTWFAKLLPRHMLLAEPLVQTGLLVLLLALPMSVIPTVLVYVYSCLLWLAQPVWLVVEVLGVIQISLKVSKELVERIEDKPNLAKGCVLFIAAVCYIIMGEFFWTIALSDAQGIKVCLAPLVVLGTMVHIAVWFSDAGVLSDAAVVSGCSMTLLYTMLCEVEHQDGDRGAVSLQDWRKIDEGMSSSRLILTTCTTSLGSLQNTWSFLTKLLHPWFLATAVVRCYSVMLAVQWLKSYLLKDEDEDNFLFNESEEADDDDDDDLEEGRGRLAAIVAWRSPLAARLVVILVYTQLVIQYVHGPLCASPLPLPSVLGVSPSRLFQILVLNVVYLYYLYVEHTQDGYDI